MDKSVKVSEKIYNMIKEIAKEQRRTIKTVIEMAIELLKSKTE